MASPSEPPPGPADEAELAEALVFDGNRVLLIRRKDVPVWTLPGGHRDYGETAAAGGTREVEEETGLQVRVVTELGCYRRPWWLSGGRAAVFHCEVVGGELQPGEYEAAVEFWPVQALPSPILYWYAPLIRAGYDAVRHRDPGRINWRACTPTLFGFLRSLIAAPALWRPLARHAFDMQLSSRIAQWRARRGG